MEADKTKVRKIIEQSLIDLWDIIKWLNICVIGVHTKKKEKREKKTSLKKQ